MANYYCLMSGLPDLTLEDTSASMTVAEVVELFKEEQDITKNDRTLLFMFLAEGDCKNLLKILKGHREEAMVAGNYSVEKLDEMIEAARDNDMENDSEYPDFMIDFIREYYERKDEKNYFADDHLMIRYWEFVKSAKSDIVSAWAELNINLSNILAALIARTQEWDAADYLVGDNEINDIIRTSKAKDYDLSKELDYVPAIMQIMACDDPVEKEKKIDALRWVWLDNMTFFNSFSMDAVFAYLCKVRMHERWRILDPVYGKQRFEEIIENLRKEVQVPEEFTLKSPYAKKEETV
ncbi:MAG: DUF2764 domain-containing protein [Bacteroidaceae bacterium]|nr:DUF2764 domain-containing protein [Bacteroidaceae bacterium]